jgi:hypothetical protein
VKNERENAIRTDKKDIPPKYFLQQRELIGIFRLFNVYSRKVNPRDYPQFNPRERTAHS